MGPALLGPGTTHQAIGRDREKGPGTRLFLRMNGGE